MTGGPITTPQSKIENAFAMFTLAVRFWAGCQHGIIPPEIGLREIHIKTGAAGLTITPAKYTKEKLVDQSFNLMLSVLGQTAIIVDEALDQKFGAKNPSDVSGLGSTRAIIYQIRNAFAHDPLNPVWRIKGKNQRVCVANVGGVFHKLRWSSP